MPTSYLDITEKPLKRSYKTVMYEMVKPKSEKPLLDIPEIAVAITELANILKMAMQ